MTGRGPGRRRPRTVPAPDAVARDYILLGLRLDQHIPGLVDGYFGPAELKAQVDTGAAPLAGPPARGRRRAPRPRSPAEVDEPDRRAWLDAQLVALETQAAALAGDALPYVDHVTRCFDHAPARVPTSGSTAAAARIDELLPGDGSLDDRLAAWDAPARGPASIGCRPSSTGSSSASAAGPRASSGCPTGEDLRVSLVRTSRGAAYNWFDGGRRSRIDVNTDLPVRAPSLPGLVAHETYPGHHLEHATKEAELVDRARPPRGLDPAHQHARVPHQRGPRRPRRTVRGAARGPTSTSSSSCSSGPACAIAADPAATRDAAERSRRHREPRARPSARSRGNAALLRHVDGTLARRGPRLPARRRRVAPARAEKRLEFIEHPLWRTYVFVYAEGEALLARWLEAVPEAERAARFGRLLREQL